VTTTGFGLVAGFIEHLQLIITSNYSAIANSCRIGHTASSQCVLTSRCLVVAFNSRRSPSSGLPNYPWAQLPASNKNWTSSCSQLLTCPAYNTSAWTTERKPSVAVQMLLSAGTTYSIVVCTVIRLLLFISVYLVMGLQATILITYLLMMSSEYISPTFLKPKGDECCKFKHEHVTCVLILSTSDLELTSWWQAKKGKDRDKEQTFCAHKPWITKWAWEMSSWQFKWKHIIENLRSVINVFSMLFWM
jgi:hypothetical protein